MVQETDYVFLPKTLLADKARLIGDETTGEIFQIPATPTKIPLGDIGALAARHFAQFVSKQPDVGVHTVDDFDPSIYKIQDEGGRVNYVLRVRNLSGKKKDNRPIAVIQKDPECTHQGTLRAYLQELNPQSK